MENKENKGIFARIYDWFKNLTVKGLLQAIFVAFVVIILLMTAVRLPSILSKVSSSFSAALYSVFIPAEGASVTADKKVINSGDEFTVTFKEGETDTDGLFTVSYDCSQNISLLAVEASGLKDIACDAPYYLLDNSSSIKIRAITEDATVVRLALTAGLENNDTQKSESIGVVRVTVTNREAGTTVEEEVVPPTTTGTPTRPTTPTAPVYYGKADLAVRVLQVGILNTRTNLIINQSQFTGNETVGVRFEVRNDGDANTGAWTFSAALPSMITPTYSSPIQNSLRPGESIQFTLGFSALTNQYSNLITINADPSSMVVESNEGNNMTTSPVINLGYNNNNYNNSNDNNYYDYNYNNSYNNGCYVDGWFTYNCNNNYNNYYRNNNNNDGVDLAVDILAVGRINSNGNFVEDNNIEEGDDAAVKFRVTNEGDEESDRWDYEVRLTPSFSGDEYTRSNMASLDPDESITVIVSFDNIDEDGENRFRVVIDPDDEQDDEDRDNNDDTETIDVD
jgi:hypothetical protein